MRIARVELFELNLPFAEPFIISGGRIEGRRSIVVVLHDDAGHVGYGESPPDVLPFYSEETLPGARDLIARVLVPRVAGKEFDSPEAVDAALRREIRGNWFARAGVETAAWDLEAHRRGTGLAQLVAERLGVAAAASVPCGVALGIPEDRAPDTLTRRVYDAVQHGYRRVKIKVAPGWDEAAVRAARAGMAGTDLPLTVDANGAYAWPDDEGALRALDDAGLLYIEQPLAPDELVGHARLSQALRTPVCLDETLRDASAARQIAALDGPRVWNIKVHRIGGLAEACRVYRVAADYGAELWAGTMPESGIGSQAALAVAALPLCVYPSDLEPSSRWFGRGADVVKLTMGKDGRMAVPGVSVARLLDQGRFRSVTCGLQ
ncbi:MAG TPA: o-succinylbenzoate synthase [Gemmatimonadales bacterium]